MYEWRMATVVGIGGKRADILRVHYEGFNENFDESVDLSKTPGRVASYGTYAYLSKGEKRGNAGDSEEGGAGGGDQSASAKRAKLSGKLEEVEKTLETALAKARDTGVEGHVEADVRRAQAALAAAKAGGAGETGGGKDAGKGAGARHVDVGVGVGVDVDVVELHGLVEEAKVQVVKLQRDISIQRRNNVLAEDGRDLYTHSGGSAEGGGGGGEGGGGGGGKRGRGGKEPWSRIGPLQAGDFVDVLDTECGYTRDMPMWYTAQVTEVRTRTGLVRVQVGSKEVFLVQYVVERTGEQVEMRMEAGDVHSIALQYTSSRRCHHRYKPGAIIDILDVFRNRFTGEAERKWRKGEVVRTTNFAVLVHYYGWNHSCDEWVSVIKSPERLAAFGARTDTDDQEQVRLAIS